MAATGEMLGALNEVNGQEKPDDIGMGEWIWGALQGDFNAERSNGQIGFDMVVSLIPIVDTICDFRDLCANIRQYRKDPDNKITLFFIATTVIGFFPEIGTVVKSALRLVWIYLKPLIKHADDFTNISKLVAATNRACDAALPKITDYLQHSRVAQWATRGKLPDIFKFVSKTIREAAAKVDGALLKKLLDEKFEELKNLLLKIKPFVPVSIVTKIDGLLEFINAKRVAITDAVQTFAHPIRTVLKVIAKRLDDHAWRVQTYRTNRGWISPISESGSAKLINAKTPKWVRKLHGNMKYPPLVMGSKKINALMAAHPNHPKLNAGQISTFSRKGGALRGDMIVGPAKFIRVLDPSNEAAGIFWISEADFKAIKNRDEWRSKWGIKPEWNQNGWFIEYEVRVGESLPVWRGPTASQKLEGTNFYLEAGAEQFVFFPGSRDEMVNALPRIDRESGMPMTEAGGNIDRRIEFVDVTGEVVPTKLRSKITDDHISGPFETGWGATDYTKEESQRILLTVPSSPKI